MKQIRFISKRHYSVAYCYEGTMESARAIMNHVGMGWDYVRDHQGRRLNAIKSEVGGFLYNGDTKEFTRHELDDWVIEKGDFVCLCDYCPETRTGDIEVISRAEMKRDYVVIKGEI